MTSTTSMSSILTTCLIIAGFCSQSKVVAFSSLRRTGVISNIKGIGEINSLSMRSSLNAASSDNNRDPAKAFSDTFIETPYTKRDLTLQSMVDSNSVVESVESATEEKTDEAAQKLLEQDQHSLNSISEKISEMTGKFDESRLSYPEVASGEVPRIFSNISYQKNDDANGNKISQALHAPGSVVGAAALVSGTTIGAGVLALPTATAPAGFLPSTVALCIAWIYMTISGLLIAELSINRIGETGRVGVGLLELYKTSLGKELAWVGSASYLFLHYAVMVAYLSQGGANLGSFLDNMGLESVASVHGLDQFLFAASAGALVYFAKPNVVENVNNSLVIGVIATFVGIIATGVGGVDFSALIAPVNQHPDMVANAFPICFLSMVYHNVVPTVVTQLEGDRQKITKSLFIGTSIPFLMFVAWNAIILGNIVNTPGALDNGVDPISLLQNEGVGGEVLGQLVSAFSELAITTSLIGFIFGLLDALTDVFGLPTKGPEFEQWKPALFAGVLLPPLFFSLGNPDIFFQALDYGGAFGVSTLFLVLPPIMVWKQRYGEEETSLTVPPMVPFGKIPLGSMWKAAATLILEQGADKLGVFDFLKEIISAQTES